MGKAVTYIKSFFPIFLLGAIFGKVMEDTGLAKSIARAIITGLGKEPHKAVMSIVIAASLLTYGGVSLFVVVFAVYPFAAALFKEANYPKRLLPGIIALGAFTATMDCLPGTRRFKISSQRPISERPCMPLPSPASSVPASFMAAAWCI